MRRRSRIVALLAVIAGGAALTPPIAGGSDPNPIPAAAPATPPVPTVVSVVKHYPKRVLVIRSRFKPWDRPTPAQAHIIARVEAARSGISLAGMERRISCESGWQYRNEFPIYHEVNSKGHYGLGQFMVETYGRGVGSIGSRRVTLKTRRERPVMALTTTNYSDGSARTTRKRVRQIVVHIRTGVLPRNPSIFNGWVNLRIVAEAIAGRSAVSSGEWSCGL